MENQTRSPKKLWKPPSFDDFQVESPSKRIKLDTNINYVEENEDHIRLEVRGPKTVEDLATHPKKIEEVKYWLEANQNKKGAVLLVTGPTGSAKTTTVQITARSLNLTVREWVNPVDKIEFKTDRLNEEPYDKFNYHESKQIEKFEDFAFRTSRYNSLFDIEKNCIILVEDFPNIFIWNPTLFHKFLEKYKELGKSPIVFISTDDQNSTLANNLFPNLLRMKYNITNIKFNPVSHTAVMRCLNRAAAECCDKIEISKATLDNISRNSNGDIRNALSGLQILLVGMKPVRVNVSKPRKKTKSSANNNLPGINPVSLKDSSVDFYQNIGRVLYPKRIPAEGKVNSNFENGNRIFVHDFREIVENYSDSFLMLLQENYTQTFCKLNDIVKASDYLSFCDRSSCYDELKEYSGCVSVLGLMTANKDPKRGAFQPIKKSTMTTLLRNTNEEKRIMYKEFKTTSRILNLDVIPYIKALPVFRNFMNSTDFNRLKTAQSYRMLSSQANEPAAGKSGVSDEEDNMEIEED